MIRISIAPPGKVTLLHDLQDGWLETLLDTQIFNFSPLNYHFNEFPAVPRGSYHDKPIRVVESY